MNNQAQDNDNYRWDVNHDTGRAIAQLRQRRGLTAEQAATAAETTETKILAIERGNLPHNVHNLARIVEAMGGRLAIVPEETPDDPHCQFIEFDD